MLPSPIFSIFSTEAISLDFNNESSSIKVLTTNSVFLKHYEPNKAFLQAGHGPKSHQFVASTVDVSYITSQQRKSSVTSYILCERKVLKDFFKRFTFSFLTGVEKKPDVIVFCQLAIQCPPHT